MDYITEMVLEAYKEGILTPYEAVECIDYVKKEVVE